MSTYVISDIHGNYKKYKRLLEMIDFKDKDTLYVLGDVIDRGPEGIKVLKDMMSQPNVIPILGNHEFMAKISLPFLMTEIIDETLDQMKYPDMLMCLDWLENGGTTTIKEFRDLSREEKNDVLDYLGEFSLYHVVTINDKEFVLVHAGFDGFTPQRELDDYDLSELIFEKPDYGVKYFENSYLVTGHTPTRLINRLMNELNDNEICDDIYERNKHIAIDCGCVYGGKLGCICLDTMEKYYV
ncbi:metallophosphoesterase [Acetobacterium wieringae]|uniref:metallophosphoesterase n=1 Tax=Acetobacterium wieringae TaxID=52694 RepID=UPI002B202787|nr:metallophosphoesterase [Acetobacterium wieringae]MEA4804645.1 metallophosphoesterase [Acetobacterium wieringae]